MSYERPITGFDTLDVKAQQALIYAGASKGIMLLPPYPFKLAARLETAGPVTVTVEGSKNNAESWTELGVFVLDTPGTWVITEYLTTDNIIVRATQTGNGTEQASCVIGA